MTRSISRYPIACIVLYTEGAAEAGIHVLCEKPMAVTEEECESMIDAAARANVKLMIAYRLHFER